MPGWADDDAFRMNASYDRESEIVTTAICLASAKHALAVPVAPTTISVKEIRIQRSDYSA